MFKTTYFFLFVCTLAVCQATNDCYMHSLNNSYFVKHNDIDRYELRQSKLTIDIIHVILMLSIVGIWNYITKDMMVHFVYYPIYVFFIIQGCQIYYLFVLCYYLRSILA